MVDDRSRLKCCRAFSLTGEEEWSRGSIDSGRKSHVLIFIGSDVVHAECPSCVSSQVYFQVKEMSLVHMAMMEILRQLLSGGRTILGLEQ